VTAVAQWLRRCATDREVVGSMSDSVIGIFHWHKILPIALWPWGRLSLQQKWVPGVFPGGKGGWCVRLTIYHHPVPLLRNMGTLTFWNPLGTSGPVMGLIYLCFYLFRDFARINVIASPFCDFTQRRLVPSHRRFGTTYRPSLKNFLNCLTLEDGTTGCPESQ